MYRRKEIGLPKSVYYQCIWIIKDIERLHRLDAMREYGKGDDEVVYYEDTECRMMREDVLEQASWKLACIKRALGKIPEEYRMDTIDSIVDGTMPAVTAHENTWKKWRRCFIKELAYELNLI